MGNKTPNTLEPQVTDQGEEKISRLLSSLPRVEAPGDFGFRVKARIADGKPVQERPMWMPLAVKAAMPLVLILFVGGYFAFTTFYTEPGSADIAAVESVQPAAVTEVPAERAADIPAEIEPANPPVVLARDIPETRPAASAPVRTASARTPARTPTRRSVDTADSNRGGGSFDAAATQPRKLSPNEDVANAAETAAKGQPAGEVLTRIGINARFSENGWKAESVSPNTAASKAGVKAGDIIHSVDGQTMTDLRSVAKPATGKKIQVLRDGKIVDIVINP